MRAVNLLPVDEARAARQGLRGPILAASAGAVVAAAAIGAVTLSETAKLSSRRADLQALRIQLAATPPVHAPAWQGRVSDAESQRTKLVADALAHRVGWERVVGELSSVLPEGVFLTRVGGTGADASGSGGASSITLEGITFSHAAVAELVARLSAMPDFTNVQLQSSLATVKPAPPSVTFSVDVTLAAPGGVS